MSPSSWRVYWTPAHQSHGTHILGMSRKWQHTLPPWEVTTPFPWSSCQGNLLCSLPWLVPKGLAKLDLRYCRVIPERVVFSLTSPRKRGNPNQLAQAFLARFPHNQKLRPVETFRHYLKKTRSVRPTVPCSKPDPLFISYRKRTVTIGCWLRLTIQDAGINTDIFKAHSVRSASTTAAASGSVPLDEIMKMADWSCSSIFQMFYYKPVFNWKYCQTVLN